MKTSDTTTMEAKWDGQEINLDDIPKSVFMVTHIILEPN